MSVDIAPPFESTAAELQDAYDEYRNRFWVTYEALD